MKNLAEYILAAVLIGVGIIRLIPITGVAGVERLSSLYGIGNERLRA